MYRACLRPTPPLGNKSKILARIICIAAILKGTGSTVAILGCVFYLERSLTTALSVNSAKNTLARLMVLLSSFVAACAFP